jgi:fructokinase
VGSGRVVVAGEGLVDVIVTANGSLTAVPGGGPFNAARAVARLGVPTEFLGAVSTDHFGGVLAAALAADGVSMAAAPRVERPTTLAVAELDSNGSATYRFYLAGTSAALLRPIDAQAVLADPPAALLVGTLGLVLQPVADTLISLVAELPREVLVLVDPNCRPETVADGAAYRRRLGHVLDRADIVKVSTEDLAYLAPGVDPVAAAGELRRPGQQVVLLTRGSSDAVALHAGGALTVPVPKVHVVDTVGAGDTFAGAYLASWVGAGLGHDDLTDVVRLRRAVERAVCAAGLACTRPGAQPPTAAELDASLQA